MLEVEKARNDPRVAFMFYREWAEALSRLDEDERFDVLNAMLELYLTGEVQTRLSNGCAAFFELIRIRMQRDFDEYLRKQLTNQENGRHGGRPKGSKKTDEGQASTTTEKPKKPKKPTAFLGFQGEKTEILEDSESKNLEISESTQDVVNEDDASEEKPKKPNPSTNTNTNTNNTNILDSGDAATAAALLELRKRNFIETLRPYVAKYGREMMNDFYFYWTEVTQDGTKMKFELQNTWNLSYRLTKWKNNERRPHPQQSARPAAAQSHQKTTAEMYRETDEMLRQQEEDRKNAITYEQYQHILELEKQGFAVDGFGNILGERKQMEAEGYVFDEWGRIVKKPDGA